MNEFLTFLITGKTGIKNRFVNDYIYLFLIVFLLGFGISFIKGYFLNINMIDEETFEKLNLETLISYVFVIPFVEETIFRAPLVIPRNNKYSILISLILLLICLFFMKNNIVFLSIALNVIILIQVLYLTSERINSFINNNIKKNYLILIYLTSLSFGILHMWNYEEISLVSFISVIGTIISGFYFAFIVTKYNFISSYILHGINNVIPFLILLAAK